MDTIPRDIADRLTNALGEAVATTWSSLSKDDQHRLFEQTVTARGEAIRAQLAVFLHEKHERTLDPLGKPREMIEPDSPGG
jgi:DnaJ-domain-containing protein 1